MMQHHELMRLLENIIWRFSQIAGHHENNRAMAEPKLIERWARDGLECTQRVLSAVNEVEPYSAELLARWVNIAENGKYGARTRFPLKAHPLTNETRAAIGAKP